jgi:hypothetical protein
VKALYLDGASRLEVALDGPALRVRRLGRADNHYPLPRVARVIAVGAVYWQAEALTACLLEHKPVAVLDSQGRFVRVLFRPPGSQYGLARHLGELLAVPRFRARYARWRHAAERAEMLAAIQHLEVSRRDWQPENLWQLICFEQYRRWGIQPGGCYRYLLGMAAAQIASALALSGMPRDPHAWERREYRLFCDLVRLERWRQAVLLEQILAGRAGQPGRRELTAAFEGTSGQRDARITAWRQRALLTLMGVRASQQDLTRCEQTDWKQQPLEMSAALVRMCCEARPSGNRGRIPLGARGSLRTSARIVGAYLEYDRRVYESYRTA